MLTIFSSISDLQAHDLLKSYTLGNCFLPPTAVSTSHLPLNKTGTNSSPYAWDHRPVQTISKDYINFQPLHTIFSCVVFSALPGGFYDLTLTRQRVLHNVSRILYHACQRRGSRCCKLFFFSASASVAEVSQRSSAS